MRKLSLRFGGDKNNNYLDKVEMGTKSTVKVQFSSDGGGGEDLSQTFS